MTRAKTKAKPKTFTLTPTKAGQKQVTMKKGQLHRDLKVPQGQKIPPSKKRAALAGKYGAKTKKRAVAAFRGILAAGRKTVAKRRRAKK